MDNPEFQHPENLKTPNQKELWDFIDQSGVFNGEQRGRLVREAETNPEWQQELLEAYQAELNYKSGGKIVLERLRDILGTQDYYR